MPTEAEVRAALDRLRVRQRDWEEETGNTPEEMELATAREDARLRGQRNVADMTRSPTSAMDLLNPSRALAAMRVGADKLDFSPGEFSASDLLTGGPRGFLEGLSNIPEGIGQGVETAARTAMAVPQFGFEGLGALGVEGAEDAAGFIRRGREQSSTETAESMDAITGRTGTIGGSVGAQTGKVATEFALTGAPLLRAFRGAGKVGQLVARALSATPIAGGEADITTLREGLEGWDRAKFILMEMGIEAGTAALFPGGKEAVFGGNRAAGALRRSLPEVPQELLADFGSTLNAYAQLPSQQNKAPLEVLHEFAQRIPETALTAFFASEAIQAGPVASRAMAERSQDRAFTQRVDEVAPQQALQIMQQTVAEQYRAEGLQAPENLVAQEGTGQETQPGPVREATFRRRRMEGREQVDPMTELKVSTETPAPRTIAKQHRQETQALFEEVGRRREAGENLRRLEVREQKVRQAAQERGEARAVREGVASVREDLNAIREDIDPEIAADIDEELNRPDLTLDEVVELGDLIEVAIDETAPATAPEAAPEAGAVAPEAAPVAPAPVEVPARPRAAAPVETAPEAVPAPVAVDTAPEPVAAPEPEPVPAAEPAAEVAESAPEPRGTRPQSAAAMRGVEAAEAARADLPDTWEEQARPMGGFTERRPKYRAPLGTSFQDWQSRLPAKDQERLSKAQTRVRAAKTAPAIARRQGEVDALRKELGWTEAHRRADRPRDNIARQETRRATGEVPADVPVQPRRSTKPTREAASEVGRVARTKNRLREAPPRVRGEILADTAPRHMQELRRAAKADPELASLMSSAVEVDIMAGEGEATEVAFMRPEAPETRTELVPDAETRPEIDPDDFMTQEEYEAAVFAREEADIEEARLAADEEGGDTSFDPASLEGGDPFQSDTEPDFDQTLPIDPAEYIEPRDRTKSRSGIPYGPTNQPTIINAVDDQGGIAAPPKKGAPGEYDGLFDLGVNRKRLGVLNRFISRRGGVKPDQMAAQLGEFIQQEMGITLDQQGRNPVDAMWSLIRDDLQRRQQLEDAIVERRTTFDEQQRGMRRAIIRDFGMADLIKEGRQPARVGVSRVRGTETPGTRRTRTMRNIEILPEAVDYGLGDDRIVAIAEDSNGNIYELHTRFQPDPVDAPEQTESMWVNLDSTPRSQRGRERARELQIGVNAPPPIYTTEQVNRLTEQTPTLQTPEDARAGMESATEVGLQPTPEQQQAVASDILSPDMRDRIADEGSRVDAAFELAAQMGTDFPTTMVMLGRVADGELTTPDQIVEELDRQTRLYSGLPGDALAPLGNAIVTMVGAGYDKTFGLWSRSLIDQVRRLPNGGPVADNARAHYDLVREHMGEAEKLRQQIMETMGASEGVFQQFAGMAGFGKSAEGARVRQELMSSTPVENADGQVVATTSVFRRAVEGKLTTAEEASLSEDARKVIGLYRELNRITGQWMTDAGAEIRLSSGEWVPFKPDADGKRLMRRATRDGIRVMRDPTSAEGQAFLDAVLVMNPDLTREQLTDAIGASADAATRLSAMERARVVENVPDTIIANGKSIPIFEPDPMAAAESQIRSSAMRSSYIQTFGQPRANSMTAVLENETIARFVLGMSLADAYTAGILNPDTTYTRDNIPVRLRESFIAAENLVNTLNGIPPNQDIPVYSPMVNTAADAWNLTMSAVKTLALSRSAVVNFPETLGNVYSYAGPVAWGSAVYSYVADVLGVQTTVDNLDATDRVDLIEEIERIGAVQQHLIHATLEPGRAMQSLGRLTRDVGMRLVLAQPINTANEYIAAVSGLLLAKDIRKHNGSWNPFMRARVETRLQMLEYTPSEIDSILGSDAPTAIMETIPGRMAEASIGTTSMGAERSRAANTRWYNHLIAFDSFAQMKWNRSMRAAKLAAGDIRTALFDPTHRNRKEALTKALASSLFAAENIGGTTAAAGFALSMRSMLLYGAMGLAIEDDEFWRNPVNYLRELFLIAFLGGPASAIVTATEDAEDLEDLVLSTLTRVSLPIGLSLDFLQMLRSEGRYANLDAADRTATFLKSRTPAAGTLQLVAFTVGMADDDPALRGAARTYWEWRRENDETPPRQRGGGAGSTLTQEEHSAQQRQFRIHSKKVIAALRSGKRPEQVVKHIEDALGIAIKVSDNGTIQEGLSRVVQSLAQRKYWNPATSDERGVWSEESIKRARSEMDPKAVAKLDAHDRAVDELISALRRTEGKEYRPARQRELQGEPSSEEDIYAALGRIRDQVPSTAEGFADEGSQFSLLRGYNPDQMAKTHGLSPEDGVRLRLMQRRAMTGVNNMLKTIALMNDRGQFKAAEKVRDQIETNATRMLNRMQQFVERRSAQSP